MTTYVILSAVGAFAVFAIVLTTIGWAIRTGRRDHTFTHTPRTARDARIRARLRGHASSRSAASGYVG